MSECEYTMPDLPDDLYLENERFINEVLKEKGISYDPPKVKLVKPVPLHPFPCTCHPNLTEAGKRLLETKENQCPTNSKS